MWLNVAFLKDHQCFISCDRAWSPLLTCEDRRQSESSLWFWKNPLPTTTTTTKSHRNNSLCWVDGCFDGQLTGAWAASRNVLSYERRPDSWLCTKKTLHTQLLTNSEIREGLHYVDQQNSHRASTCARHLLTHVWLSWTHNCTLQPRLFWEHACSNWEFANARRSPQPQRSVFLHQGPSVGFFRRGFRRHCDADDTWLKLLALMDGSPVGCLSCLSQWISASIDSNLLLLTPN